MPPGPHAARAAITSITVAVLVCKVAHAQPARQPESAAASTHNAAPAVTSQAPQPAPLPTTSLNPEQSAPDLIAGAAPAPFGAAGTRWITFGPGAAMDGRGATDLSGFVQATWFIVQDVEFGGELAAWHFDQEGEDAAGASIAALIRWHFVNEERLSLFVDGGIGLLGSSDDVPAGGTDLNFLPRAGFGATYRPWDGDMRVMLGLRWHHISNARSSGAEDNPSRDGAMLYLGLSVPF